MINHALILSQRACNAWYKSTWILSIAKLEKQFCSNNSDNDVEKESLKEPEEPTACCMSGCANCVWIEYAEKLTSYYQSQFKDEGLEKAKKEILQKVTDPNMQAYLMMELRNLEKKLKDS